MAIATTKEIVAQAPLYAQANDGSLALMRYQDTNTWPWETTDERAAALSAAKASARRVGGRVIARVTTVDDNDTADELKHKIVTTETVLTRGPKGTIALEADADVLPLLLSALSALGQPWADSLAARWAKAAE